MCGRYVQSTPLAQLGQFYDAKVEASVTSPHYNASPTQMLPVVRERPTGQRVIHNLRWGLVPSWSKDTNLSNRLINARAESIETKPSFKDAFARRRCVVPLDGFYDWRREGAAKQPYFVYPSEEDLFSAAGLWERWISPRSQIVDTFTIITVDANALVGAIHPRMPALLVSSKAVDTWLNPHADIVDLRKVLRPAPVAYTAMRCVSQRVNSTNNEGCTLIEESRQCA